MATNGVKSSVTLSVSAEISNLRQIQEQLRQALQNGVKSDSGIFKELTRMLDRAVQQTNQLAEASEQPFTSTKGIEKFNNDFTRTSNLTRRIAEAMQDLKFDQLNIPQDKLDRLNTLSSDLQKAQQQLKQIDSSKLQELANAGDEVAKVFTRANIDVNTDNLEESIDKINSLIFKTEKKINEFSSEIQSSKLIVGNLESKNKDLTDLTALISGDKAARTSNATFGQFFRANTGAFKNGGQNEMVERLKEYYGFSEAQVETIIKAIKGGAKEIEAAQEEAVAYIKKAQEKNENLIGTQNQKAQTAQLKMTAVMQEQQQNRAAQQQIFDVQNSQEYANALADAQQAIANLYQAISQLKTQILDESDAAKTGASANDQLSNGLNGVDQKAEEAADSLEHLQQTQTNLSNIKSAIANWMGFNQILQLSRQMVRNIINDIRELDKVMTEIAVVTDMTQKDLWAQMNTYQAIARQYAVSTQGVYQVSQIWYQQGLKTAEVMDLTTETLKMAKIAGLDYATATDYMTVAIRGFHMEIEEASHVVDVYSKIAAVSASDTEELATAMSKTASSAAAVGASFENTTAFMALMIETTRESAENIGSALKSIISRYGELKTSPDQLVDSEGEAMSFNKVETALQSVGITMHDVNGQFRDFDDVILELSSKWDTLDTNTQRYIATVMAGNRQQSRFIALVSSYDRLSELVEDAANAEDAATLQTLKTLDSLESKIQNLKNAWQGFYANLGLEEVFKTALDFLTGIINRLNNMPKIFGKIPAAAIIIVGNAIKVIKGLASGFINYVVKEVDRIRDALKNSFIKGASEGTDGAKKVVNGETLGQQVGGRLNNYLNQNGGILGVAGQIASVAGTALTTGALAIGDKNATTRGVMTGIGGVASTIGKTMTGFGIGGPYGALMGFLSSIPNLAATATSAMYDITHATELHIKALKEELVTQKQNTLVANNEVKNYEQAINKLNTLIEHQYDSNEAYQELIDYRNSLIDTYPQLLDHYDSEGNALISNAVLYQKYADAILEAKQAAKEQSDTEYKIAELEATRAQETVRAILQEQHAITTGLTNLTEGSPLAQFAETHSLSFPSDQVKLTNEFDLNTILKNLDEFIAAYEESADDIKEGLSQSLNNLLQDSLHLFDNQEFYDYLVGYSGKEDIGDISFEELLRGLDAFINGSVDKYTIALEEASEKQNISNIGTWLAKSFNGLKTIGKIEEEAAQVTFSALYSDFFSNFLYYGYGAEGTDTEAEVAKIAEGWTEIIAALGKEGWKSLTNVLEHPESYSNFGAMETELRQILGDNYKQLENNLLAYYTNAIEPEQNDTRSRAITRNSEIIANFKTLEDKSIYAWTEVFDNESFLIGFQSRYYDLFSNWLGQIKQFAENGQFDMAHNFSYLTRQIGIMLRGNDELQSMLLTSLLGTDFNDKTSVKALMDSIEAAITNASTKEERTQLESIKALVSAYRDGIYEVLNTQVERVIGEAQKALSSYEEALKTGSKGFTDISEMNLIAAKFDMSAIGEDINSNAVFYFDELQGAYYYTAAALSQLHQKAFESLEQEQEKALARLKTIKAEVDTFDTSRMAGDSIDSATTLFGLDATTEQVSDAQEDFYNWLVTQQYDFTKGIEWYIDQYKLHLTDQEALISDSTNKLIDALTYQNALSEFPIDDILAGTVTSVTQYDYKIQQWLEKKYKDAAIIKQYSAALERLNAGAATENDWSTLYQILIDAQIDDAYDKLFTAYTKDAENAVSTLSSLTSLSTGSAITLNESQVRALQQAGYYGKQKLEDILARGLQRLEYGSDGFVKALEALLNSASDALHSGQMTLEEYNKQVLQVATFGNSDYNTAIPDAISGLEKITVDSLASFATALGVELKPDFDVGELKGLQKIGNDWVVNNFEALAQSIAAQSTGVIELDMGDSRIQAAIASLRDNLVKAISSFITLAGNGVKGTLSAADTVNLTEYAKSLNYDGKLDFTQTAEGMKLTADSAAQLYDWLRKTQGLQGQLAFQEYAKSLKDSSSTYKDIFATEREIVRLNKEIESSGDKQNDNLRAQLNLAKQIALIQMSDTDSYSFMDRKLPNDFAGPTNFWNAVDDMYSALGDAASTGYLSTQDFYNMIMAANDMAASTGQEITLFGETLNGDATKAAELIERGFDALTHVDGKGLMVSLEGMGVDFKAGAQSMSGNFEEGMQEFAASQVTLLDGLISFVKTIVAMENIGDLAGKDGILDLGDIFNINEGNVEATANFKDFVETLQQDEELWQQLSDIYIDSRPLTELLTSAELTKEDAKLLTQILNAIWQMAKSDDWDITDLSTIMASLAEGFNGLDGEVEIGRAGLVFKGGFALQYEYDPDTNEKVWLIGDQKYTNEKEAMLAAFAQDAGDAYDANAKTFTIGGFTAKVDADVENSKITYNGTDLKSAIEEQWKESGQVLDFDSYLESLGLALDANDKIVLKADDFKEAIDPQITAVEANTTATEENTKALNQFGEAMFNTDGGGRAKPSVSTPSENAISNFAQNITEQFEKAAKSVIDTANANSAMRQFHNVDYRSVYHVNKSGTAYQSDYDTKKSIEQINRKYQEMADAYAEYGSTVMSIADFAKKWLEGWRGDDFGAQNIIGQPNLSAKTSTETTSPFVSIINNFITEAKDKITNVIDNLQDTVEQAKLHQEQVAREASVNGETDEYVHIPDTLEEEFTQQVQSFADVVGVAYEDIYSAWQSAKAEDSSLAWDDFIAQYQQTLSETGTSLSEVTTNGEDAAEALGTVNTTGKIAAPALRGIATPATRAASGLSSVAGAIGIAIESLHSFDTRLRGITGAIVGSGAKPTGSLTSNLSPNLHTKATGSFGNAFAAGTLMGELGPELWVSHGHYYVAGQNGAEFVNLPDDAIVFNHLQTQRLLGNGSAGGHGKPVTNERKATSLATGNVNGGPAKASASDTLNQLLQLRAMWQAIADMSVSDLGKKAGSGGGGGGGSAEDMKVFVGELQRWFNLTQEIAKLEKDITREQKQRAVYMSDQIAHGKEIYESYRKEFNALKDEINATQTLADLQQSWYEKRRKDFESSGLSKIFTFDENGVMKYTGNDQPQSGEGLDILATLYQTDSKGVSIFENAGAQMDYLKSVLGVGDDFFKQLSDGSGNQISADSSSEEFLQAWDDLVNSWKDEMTELYDEYNENQMKVYELQSSQNEIIQSIIDNQLSLEQRVLTALIDKAQKAIDDLQKSRDAMADANERYINGLNDSLQKQRDMYDRNESANELNKLQRQLAILQRSGGSASQIRSLQQQINDQMQDSYFTAQQDQINVIKEAADAQIDRLDRQIELMTETLAYQKENGLFWSQVYEIMQTWDPTAIEQFIAENTKAMQGLSALDLSQQMRDVAEEIGIYQADLQESIAAGTQKGLSQEHYTEPEHVTMNNPATNSNSTAAATTTTTTPKSGGGGSGGGSGVGGINNSNTSTSTQAQTGTLILRYKCEGEWIKPNKTISVKAGAKINTSKYGITISGYKFMQAYPSSITVGAGETATITLYYGRTASSLNTNNSSGNKANLKDTGFANGGLVDYTGPAQVHGSKTRPESFFDAASTAILRNDVLGSINVLDSLLADVSTVGTSHLNLGSNESLSIANPVININIDKIANDYDAKRAGQLAFDEMVKIARQSGNRSLSRR